MIEIKLKTKGYPLLSVNDIVDDSGPHSSFVSGDGKLYLIFDDKIMCLNTKEFYSIYSDQKFSVLCYCSIRIEEL